MNQTTTIATNKSNNYISSKLGMWLFLFTEILFFGGMFLLYSVYRATNPDDFHNAAQELNILMGATNTIVLLTSSLTMVLSISSVQKGNKKVAVIFLLITVLLGCVFLVNKYFEWGAKFQHGIYPNSKELLKRSEGEALFYSLYFVMTGLHGLHVVAGVVLLSVMLVLVIKKPCPDFVGLENSGLYWHLVDIIWIFLFPLFYLIT